MSCARTMVARPVATGLVVALAVMTLACRSSSPAPLTPGPLGDSQEAEALRALAFAYWEAFNAYDADGVLAFLEEGYGREREEKIRGDIGRLKLFSVQLGVTEESPPSMVDEDEWEMYLTMK